MPKDRLLSEQEVQTIIDGHSHFSEFVLCEAVAEAQRDLTAAAVNAEWVEWAEKAKMDCSTRQCEFSKTCMTEFAGYYCKLWQERKKEKGL